MTSHLAIPPPGTAHEAVFEKEPTGRYLVTCECGAVLHGRDYQDAYAVFRQHEREAEVADA